MGAMTVAITALAVITSVAHVHSAESDSYSTANWTNVTVWHVHPQSNARGSLTNMNSGNAMGDLFFASRDRWLPLACQSADPPGECHMTEVNDPAVLAVSELIVEMDMNQMGMFKSCNLVNFTKENANQLHNYTCMVPRNDSSWRTLPQHQQHQQHQQASPPGVDPCSYRTGCGACVRGTGHDDDHCLWCEDSSTCHSFDSKPPNGCAPSHCVRSPEGGHSNCTVWANVSNCAGYTPSHGGPDHTALGTVTVGQFFGDVATRPIPPESPPWAYWKTGLVLKFGAGIWYSTVSATTIPSPVGGECTDGHARPPNCSWRVVSEVKRVSKTCSDASVNAFVQASDQRGCFNACPPNDRTNTSSLCWVECFFDTLLGQNSSTHVNTTGGLPLESASTAWRRPFASEDPTQGGCPPLL
eukprot:m.217466 g.217466  ORF g.217466 m.217466 type:complete len:413 (+) comp29115_c0_seq1:66-1304(+)